MFIRAPFATGNTIARQRLFNRVAELVASGVLRTTLGEHDGRIKVDNLRCASRAGIASHPRQTGAGGILSER